MTRAFAIQPCGGQIDDGVHCYPLRIYFEDTDLSGAVYHANYLRFLERARSDMLRLAGIDQRRAHSEGTGSYAVYDLAIRYLAPAHLDDDLLVRSVVTAMAGARCVIEQTVWRGATRLASATVTVVFLGPDGRPRRQPAEWLARFSGLLNGVTIPS